VRPLVLVAHGSRDPRAARSTWALTRAVGAARVGYRVGAAFLDFEAPRLPAALAEVVDPAVTVVPLLLTAAYHGRVDVPGEVAKAPSGTSVALAEVLGPVAGAAADAAALDLVVRALHRRLAEALGDGPAPDGIVLGAAGTKVVPALATVDLVASALGTACGVPCLPGYASGSGAGVPEAVAALRANGARRIAAAAYFLAPGLLYDRVADAARDAGAVAAAAPLDDASEIVDLVLLRAEAARS
jgi:sirohydrochlorin ferrochelatase